MLLKLLREGLGQLIVIINFITLPRKMKRNDQMQAKVNEQASKMSLYQFKRCSFCVRTRRQIHRLNLPIEYRDASQGSPHREQLENEGGQVKVPCLRIEEGNNIEWMYESADIISYLNNRFGEESSSGANP